MDRDFQFFTVHVALLAAFAMLCTAAVGITFLLVTR